MNHPEENKGIRCHLSTDERYDIQTLLNSHQSIRSIARSLNRSSSTILREIQRHKTIIPEYGTNCSNKRFCYKRHVCGSVKCKKYCKNCPRCKKHCSEYIKITCDKIKKTPYLCNGCLNRQNCNLEKHIYKASEADEAYRAMLVDRREGFDLTLEQIESINTMASPLIMQGLSPYHIKQTLGKSLTISESTLRRLIAKQELDARNIDLIEQVKRKPRHHKYPHPKGQNPKYKEGHLYSDYLSYISENDVITVQMDCVEGKREDSAVLLTLHFPSFHMQLAFILNEHSSKEVITTLDIIEEALGPDLFKSVFEVILTDNGHEFMDIKSMERSIYGGKRTTIFFCEPNRSDEKGSCENNHRMIRHIIPKGTSLERFTQPDISLMMNHINSYARKSLFGSTPYKIAKSVLPEDFFFLLGLEEIPMEQVLLKPSLLKK